MDKTFNYLNSNILIIGGKESGKTAIVRDIYSQIQNNLHEVHVFSNVTSYYTDITNAIYNDFFLIENFISICHDRPTINKLVIVENIIDKNQIKLIEDLLFQGKNYNVTVIVTIQNPMEIMPEYRSEFKYVFTSHYDFYSDQKKLHDFYFYMYTSFDYFRDQIMKLNKYEFLGVKVQSSPYVCIFKAILHDNLRFIPTQKISNKVSIEKEELMSKIVDIIGDISRSLNKLTDNIKQLNL